jgi:uncharacterized DUF497 family protein
VDVHNVGHIALHGVSPGEVEDLAGRRHIMFPSAPRGREKRWKLLGRTASGRYLVVIFTVRHSRFRTVTAYTMNLKERKLYAPEIEG